jgi:beta-galactosidase
VGDSLNLNFEQTDRGIVLTVNAAVSGQGPKFRRTAFPIPAGKVSARFRLYRVEDGVVPPLFGSPSSVPAPFRPFITQYDTYLMRFADITQW